jgi:hypothetical protein
MKLMNERSSPLYSGYDIPVQTITFLLKGIVLYTSFHIRGYLLNRQAQKVLVMISCEQILQQMRPVIRAFHRGKWPESPKRNTPPRDAQTLYREWRRRNGL